ncbi:MAG: hypothetical protein V2B18_03685 [Pseudomonadota bacterium]
MHLPDPRAFAPGDTGITRLIAGLVVALVTGFFVLSQVGPAAAWEFSLRSAFTWEYYLYSGTGPNGFFGSFNEDNSDPGPAGYGGTRGSAASMNGWLGNEIGQMSSGSDMSLARIYMRLDPEWRINEAIRIRGSYRIGSWAVPSSDVSAGALVSSKYVEGTAPGVSRSFSPGYWNTLWVSAGTPLGTLVVGKRPEAFGTGLMYDATDNADAAGLLLVSPIGPLRIGFGFSPRLLGTTQYYSQADKNAVRQIDVRSLVTYDSGAVSMGALGKYRRTHLGPESASFQGTDTDPPTGRFAVIPTDTDFSDGSIFFKYNDGTFFFNAEAAWAYARTRRQRRLGSAPGTVPDGSGRSLFAPDYVEHWRWARESGAVLGPIKMSSIWAWIPGPDRRHGMKIDRQADLRSFSEFGNVSLFKPYSLLMSYTYGGGNNSFTRDSGHGYMTDATTQGVRVDYAAASNLNFFGSYFMAERSGHGYGWGFIRPDFSTAPPLERFTGNVAYVEVDQFLTPAPSIPDGDLGWEVDCGATWQLLDGFTLSWTLAYWQPGRWFSFACVDRTVPNWKNPTPGNYFGTDPSRRIDPVFGMELLVSAEF